MNAGVRWIISLGCISLSFAQPALDIDRLTALLDSDLVEMDRPGLRAAIRFPDGRIVRAAVGQADRELNIALDDTVGVPGGSTGKTFVATLTMMLIDEGVLSLEDPISKWVGKAPWYPRLPNADLIKVKHLLSHSSGIMDYPTTFGFTMKMIYRVIRYGSAKFTPEELIELVLDKKPEFKPGNGFIYSDPGYLVLGKVIESATGRSYYDLLKERILIPHQLHQIRPQDRSIIPNIATGYTGGARNIRKDGRMKYDPSSEWTGGGLITNPTMLVQFYSALVAGDIIAADKVQAMIHGGWRNPETPDWHYGYGLSVYNDGEPLGHGGLWPGYRTYVAHYQDSGITIAVQTNRDGRVDMIGLVIRIDEMVRQSRSKLN